MTDLGRDRHLYGRAKIDSRIFRRGCGPGFVAAYSHVGGGENLQVFPEKRATGAI